MIGGLGIAIGMAAALTAVLVAKHKIDRLTAEYEARLRARDKRIRSLLKDLDGMEKARHREHLMAQVRDPLGGRQ